MGTPGPRPAAVQSRPDVLIALWFVTGFPAVGLGGILALANWGKTGDEDPARWLAYTGTALGATGPAHLTLALIGILR